MRTVLLSRVTAIVPLLLISLSLSLPAQDDNNRVDFHQHKLSLVPAKDWQKVERPNTLAAYASADKTSSIFFSIAQNDGASTMEEVLDSTITNFEVAFKVLKVGEYKSGKIKGPGKECKAIFATLELEWEGKSKSLPFRFYLTMFDVGDTLYLIQASTQKPVKKEREKEILTMIRSVTAMP